MFLGPVPLGMPSLVSQLVHKKKSCNLSDIDVVDMDGVCLFQRNDKALYNIEKNFISERTWL